MTLAVILDRLFLIIKISIMHMEPNTDYHKKI